MKRIALTAVLGAALIAGPASVDAHHRAGHTKGPKGPPPKAKKCGVVKRGFVVRGTNASFAVTQNADGTYDGSVTLTATRANRHARKSGVNASDSTAETFALDDTKIKLVGVTDGSDPDTTVDPDDVQATDVVRLIGKIPFAKRGPRKRPCGDQGFGSDRYGDPTIRRANVKRPAS